MVVVVGITDDQVRRARLEAPSPSRSDTNKRRRARVPVWKVVIQLDSLTSVGNLWLHGGAVDTVSVPR